MNTFNQYRGKLTKEHYEALEETISKLLIDRLKNHIHFLKTNPVEQARIKDLTMRFCFDILHAAKVDWDAMQAIYKYANDDHIFTALKVIVIKGLGIKIIE